MIEGVKIKHLKPIPDERGRLMEMLRCDDDIFEKFGQIYLTTAYPGVIKGWHCHRKQFDNLCAVRGMVKLVMYDGREDSPTFKQLQELYLGEHSPLLASVPPMVYHGFKCVGLEEALVINCPTEPYDRENPDEIKLPPDTEEIPYDWRRKDK